MAKKIKGGSVEFEVSDGGSLKKLEKNSKRAGEALGSVAKNAQEADRRLKGTANMSSNSTKNFAKQAQSISGGLVPAYATLAAQVFAVSAAFEFLKSAFNTRNLIEGQKAFSAVTGVAYRSLTKDIKAATNGMLSFEEAAQAAAIGTAAGLTRGQLTAIGKAATDVSLALGRDLTDSFNRLTRGITKAEPELLDELGIVLRLDPAMKNYATSVGKAVADLTQFERSQAIANEVLGQAESKFGAIQKIMDPSAFALGQFSAAFNDLMVEFKVGLVEFLTPTIKFLSNNVEALTGALALGLAPVLRSILPDFKNMGLQAERSLEKLRAARDLATAEAGLFAQRASVASGKGRAGLIKSSQSQAKQLGIALKGEGGETLSKRQLTIYKKQLLDQELLDKKYQGKKLTMFREFLINQEALLMKTYAAEEGLRKKNEFEERASLARREAAHKAFFMRITKIVGAFAATANAALSAIGWLGLIALIASAGKAAYDFFNPPDPETTKLKEKLDEIKDRARDLTKDLERMREVQAVGLLGMTGITEQRGQAAASADILNALANFNTAIKAGDKRGALDVVKSVMALNDVLGQNVINERELLSAVRNGTTISQAQMQAANGLAQKYIIAGQATKQFAQDQQALNNALRGAVSVSLPMSNLATSFSAAIGSLQASVAADPSSLGVVKENIANSQSRIADMKKNLFGTGVIDRVLNKRRYDRIKAGGPQNDEDRAFIKGFNERMRALKAEIDAQKYLQDSLEQQMEASKERQKLLESYQKHFKSILKIQQDSFILEQDKINLEKERMALPLNNELGTKNALEDLKVDQQKLKVREAELAKRVALKNLQVNASTANDQELEGLQQLLYLANKRLELENSRQDLVDRQVEKQKLLNRLADNELQTQRLITRAKLGLSEARGKDALTRGATGTRAGLRLLAEQEVSYQRREVGFVQQQLADNENRILELRAKGKDGETEYQNALDARIQLTMQLVDAQNKLLQSEQALTSAGFFAQQGLAADARQAQLSVGQNVGMLGRATIQGDEFTKQALALMESQGYTSLSEASAEERERLKNTVQEATVARIELGLMQETSSAIQSSFSGLFTALLDGTKSLKQALGDMMKQLLSDLAQAYLKAALLQSLSSMGFGLPGARYGGIMSPSGKSFAVGGIASGPTSGYMATLHGTEAVVPLGNDRSIPVELKGGGGSNVVNVSVNVAADGQSNVSAQGGNMEGLGKVIGQAVQQELMRQKRPGGMLSPYGAA